MATDYTQQLMAMPMPQANFAQTPPSFIQGLGGALFPASPGMDPQAAQAAQGRALLQMGLGMMGAGSRPGATLGGALSEGYGRASQNYTGAMDQAFRNTLVQKESERQERKEEREEKAAERAKREDAAVTAGRIASGLASSKDPMSHWNLIKGIQEVQDTAGAYGIDPATITTPEQLQTVAQQFGAAGQIGGPVLPRQPLNLKSVVGPDGKPILVPETMAVGAQPFEKSSQPGSWEEYIRAQSDPEYRKFLESRRGKGFSMTLPDGTVVEMGGAGGGVGPDELSKPTVNKLQNTIISSTDRLDRLNTSLDQYNPEFLRLGGITKAWTTRVKDFAGLDVSEGEREFLQQTAAFQSQIKLDLSLYLAELSGAAITEHELNRLKKSAPSGDELSPAEFESKSRQTVKSMTRAIMRANWALKNGIGVKSVEELSKTLPLDSIDAVYEQRANEIWQEMGGDPSMKAEAVRRANEEFGLAR